MRHHADLDGRFWDITEDQRHADRHLYRWDRKRGWGIDEARTYVNLVIDHQVAHRLEQFA